MFTGIVQEKGRIEAMEKTPEGRRLALSAPETSAEATIGDSIAVDGCCLTAVRVEPPMLWFDLLEETFRVTAFAGRNTGDSINLESSLRFNGRLGGHFVTGHIDCTGTVSASEARGADRYLEVIAGAEWDRYLVFKGSIAINGVSLTVAGTGEGRFSVWLIPHTLEVTNLDEARAGAAVNLEFDLLGKYVEKLLEQKALDR